MPVAPSASGKVGGDDFYYQKAALAVEVDRDIQRYRCFLVLAAV
jgi:hypothetical protein